MALCNVTGTVYLPNGQLARSRTIVFRRVNRNITAEYLGTVLPDDVLAQTSTSGQIDVSLLTGYYVAHAEGQYAARIAVPDAPEADFSDIVIQGEIPAVPPAWLGDIQDQLQDLNARVTALEGGSSGNVVMLTPPTATPETVTVGDNTTLTLGTYSNATSVVGVLMQGGIDRTGEIVDGVWSPGVDGAATWTVTASGIGGPIVTVVNITVEAIEPEQTVKDVALFWIDADTPFSGSDSEVTGVTAEGSGGYSMVVAGAGSPNLITHTGDGFVFGAGRYLTVTGISPDVGDGAILLVDVTFNDASGTGQALAVQGTVLRRASGTLQYTTGEWTSPAAQNVGTVTPPQRVLMAMQLDRVGENVRYWDVGASAFANRATTFANPITKDTISLGQGMNGIIHKAAIIAHPSGGALPMTFEDALADFSDGGVTPPVTSVTIHDDDGQSLALGPNVGAIFAPSGNRYRDEFNGGAEVRMLTGLRRADSVAITQVASPLLQGYDTDTDATGDGPGTIGGNVPGGSILAKALVRDGVIEDTAAFQFHGAGGQPVSNFGVGTTLYNNEAHWLAQAVAHFSPADVTVPRRVWNQGEADRLLARGAYKTAFDVVFAERNALIQTTTGQVDPPQWFMFQTGGYMRKQDNHWMVLDQIDIVREGKAILIGPNWQVPVADGNVHPGIAEHIRLYETAAWCIYEVEAGRDWNLLPPASVTRTGDTITIPISIRGDETLTTVPGKYADYGGDPDHLGLEVVGGGSIVSASVSGGNIVLEVSGTVTAVKHAHQRAAGIDYADWLDSDGKGYVAHRSLIRTTLTKNLTVAGHALTLERWVPSFEVDVT